ncbi:MAG: methyltransferase domain-containing protein [Chitinophagales bacterium]
MSDLKCSKDKAPSHLDATFWDNLWQNKITGWDLNAVSPPLQLYFDSMTCKNKSILIPGCGNAYEAIFLLENGFKNVTVIDIAPTLVQQLLSKLAKYAGKELTIICGDFFKHTGQYDFIIEQTFFCALDRNLRTAYAIKMKELLKETGKLAGLLFDKEFKDGPPFGGSKTEYEQLFKEHFNIQQMDVCMSSVKPRLGAELFFELTKK